MASLKDLKNRIGSVKKTEQITSAMRMVAAAKLRRAQSDIIAARPYAIKTNEVLISLVTRTNPDMHPLLRVREPKKCVLVVVASDRGLCGSFNQNVFRKADAFIKENKGKYEELSLVLVGKRSRDFFKRKQVKVRKSIVIGNPSYELASEIGDDLIDGYINGEFDELYIIFNEFKSAMTQILHEDRVLPVERIESDDEMVKVEYLCEPTEDVLLDALLPMSLKIFFYRALLESAASEHGARMTAMESASGNAGDMIEKLSIKYNRARQAAITTELMEVVSGAEALKG
ncbi:MAG: ATP synthase gamma chain [Deltaproteobacteria bacterium ADurb.BinA179]|jgi:F-type H+-transporting ATPase subunit gamma|nr:ATP synthase F1 subunit gamma [Deltaproteobacteria bacterium]MDI9542975.1 ATP synthase F1 subunit gamma [Pseudomonadota bacterium]OPZ23442.1 MAG: ATP synthase gamma chain [Deltaproteobacteria bacterium ADurb.BinA179]HNU75859.1 ATP synthase F1 subunit gamma [Deltaproteobacteria bacterium]HOD70817.1 ATP synthase F1 subunit gamma [Deltaproteobacteria bacterium]